MITYEKKIFPMKIFRLRTSKESRSYEKRTVPITPEIFNFIKFLLKSKCLDWKICKKSSDDLFEKSYFKKFKLVILHRNGTSLTVSVLEV